ncbi:N-acylneuraminate cytidylyltransferase [Flavobacterium gossypii]|uniref:N-acylneuraminate cytidylyltransferase n=1 Tax=Flavobacterium gossypii TaxID=1646119 RepID=A0ABR6DT32_9FLAO|nr:acylneuraminate cytidylyltransferase family protein [Flavobacterium gossypii]MBA9074609.1 N-acylneuraminate cytidylyltransferase [Flavobacterium gossypii]
MKTIAIIPARGGSKRLPGKNSMLLGGIPLVAHSILYAQADSRIDAVYVSTDDAEIKKIAIAYGAQVIDRPQHLAGDLEPTVTALKHVLESLESKPETVVLLQPTNPLRPKNLLQNAFEIYEKGRYKNLFTVTQSHQKLGKIKEDKFIPFNYEPGQRSQDLEPLYFENGLLYICKSELILNDTIISKEAYPMLIDHPFGSVDIDTLEDFDYAVYLHKKHTL